MIRINLLGEKVDRSGAYLLQTIGLVAILGLTIAGCAWFYASSAAERDMLASKKRKLEAELTDLKKQTEKVGDLDQQRKVLQTKLTTIASLKLKKHGPVHMLDDLNVAIPDKAWLTSIKDKAGSWEISGIALDDPTVSVFIMNLDQSKYFSSIELIQTTETAIKDVKLKQFLILLKFRDMLSSQRGAQGTQKVVPKENQKSNKDKA